MRLELTGRHIEITPALRRLVDTKLARLERLLNDSAVSAQVVLAEERARRQTEVTLHARGEKFLHAVGSAAKWETSLGQAVARISQQAQKMKGKWQERKRRVPRLAPAAPVPAGSGAAPAARGDGARGARIRPRVPRIMKASRQALKAMTVSEALLAIDAGGDGLVVFRDAETGRISVVYRSASGDVALVETET